MRMKDIVQTGRPRKGRSKVVDNLLKKGPVTYVTKEPRGKPQIPGIK